jgi:hypothetical protein
MKPFDDESKEYKKKPRHASNVKGQGMRILNQYVEEYDEEDFDINMFDDEESSKQHPTIQRLY